MISNDLFKHDLDDYHIPTFLGRPRPGWIHEIKHDGFRILARRDAARARLISRKAMTTRRFPFIEMAVAALLFLEGFTDDIPAPRQDLIQSILPSARERSRRAIE
jgi:ATP-dependent DNA ligase